MKNIIGIFFILHGLVHLLYMGHSLNYFELEKGFVWPENSRLLKNLFTPLTRKLIAASLCIVAALSFVASGIFVLTEYSFVVQGTFFAVISSTILFLTFWDGSTRKMHTQGGIAILINGLILVYIFALQNNTY